MYNKKSSESNNKEKHNNILGPATTKLVLMAVLAAFLVFIYSGSSAEDVKLEVIEDKLVNNTDLTELMVKQSDRDVMQFIGLDTEQYAEVLYYRNTTALAVEELLIVKCKDEDQIAEVKEAVDTRISSQIKAYESYGPEQVKQLKSAVLKSKGNYYFYATGDNAGKYEEVWLDAI